MSQQTTKLAVVDVLDRDGRVLQAVPVWQWPVTIGRSVECDVVLDDGHVAPMHVVADVDGGCVTLRAGESHNGVRLAERRLMAGELAEIPPGSSFEVGVTRLRIRRASDALAPERPLQSTPRHGGLSLVILGLAFVGWLLLIQWLHLDRAARVTDYVEVIVGTAVLSMLWISFWTTMSKLVHHKFDLGRHLRLALSYSLGAFAVAQLLPLLSFSSGWVIFSRLAGIAGTAVACALVMAHLAVVWPARRRALSMAVAVLFVGGVALHMVGTYQRQDRILPELFVKAIGHPALRFAPAVSSAVFIEESKRLQAVLETHIDDE